MGGLVESFSVFFWTLGLELGFNFMKRMSGFRVLYCRRGFVFFAERGWFAFSTRLFLSGLLKNSALQVTYCITFEIAYLHSKFALIDINTSFALNYVQNLFARS